MIATIAPRRARSSEIPLPMPRLPPVTIAVRLRREIEVGMGLPGRVVGVREPIVRTRLGEISRKDEFVVAGWFLLLVQLISLGHQCLEG